MKNKKAEAIWEKIIINDAFKELVRAYRKKYSIPEEGFTSEKEFQDWLGNIIHNSENLTKSIRELVDIQKYVAYKLHIDITGMEDIIDEYVHYGDVKENTLSRANTTGCELTFVDEENIDRQREQMEAGYIYVKISPTTRPTDIALFLKQKRIFLQAIQKVFIEERKIHNKKTKFKTSKFLERDWWIGKLYSLPIEKLNELSGSISTHKDINVAKIMAKRGYKVSEDSVRKIVQKQKDRVNFKQST